MKSHCLYLHPSQMPAPRVHNIGPARGSFCPYVHCSLHQHSHGTDTDTGVSRHCRGPHPRPGPMSTQTQGALHWGHSALICALYRALRFLGALCRMWQPERTDPSDDAGGNIPHSLGEYIERGVRGIYTPGDSIKRGAKIAACCQVVGDYIEWG